MSARPTRWPWPNHSSHLGLVSDLAQDQAWWERDWSKFRKLEKGEYYEDVPCESHSSCGVFPFSLGSVNSGAPIISELQRSGAVPEFRAVKQLLISSCSSVLISIPVPDPVRGLNVVRTFVRSVQGCMFQLLNPGTSSDSGSSSSRQTSLPCPFAGLVHPGPPEVDHLLRHSGPNASSGCV